jgi:hypothetical protein
MPKRPLEVDLGSIEVDGRRRSLRLNPQLAQNPEKLREGLEEVVESQPPPIDDLERMMVELEKATEETNNELRTMGIETTKSKVEGGGKRRYRGGDDELFGGVLDDDRVAIVTTAATAMAYKAGQMTKDAAVAAAGPSRDYLKSRFAKMTPRLARLKDIVLTFADRTFQLPITAANVAIASLGFTVNFVSFILEKVNKWGEEGADYLLSDETARKAADAATDSVKSTGATVAVAAFAANQLGVLPLSAVLAAILFTIQTNLGTGAGRAYLITGFYAWYNTKSKPEKDAINAAANEYANAAKDAAKAGIKAAEPKVKEAARKLGDLLSKKGKVASTDAPASAGAGGVDKNAVQAMVTEEGAPASASSVVIEDIPAVLVSGAAAAGLAAVAKGESAPAAEQAKAKAAEVKARPRRGKAAVGDDGAGPLVVADEWAASSSSSSSSAAPGKGGRRGKTKKGKSKRRVTRRRKAPKYLAAPVFVY